MKYTGKVVNDIFSETAEFSNFVCNFFKILILILVNSILLLKISYKSYYKAD